MAPKPETSLTIGLATAAMVVGIYQYSMPGIADVRSAGQNDPTIASTEKSATWIAAAVVSGVSLLAKDPTVFILGGAVTMALAWHYRHANAVNPKTGKASQAMNGAQAVAQIPSDSAYSSTPDSGATATPTYQVEGF
jgi:hypothetical protein